MQAHSRRLKMVRIGAVQRLAECVKFWLASSYLAWPFYFILGQIMRYREICCSVSGVVFWCVTFWRFGLLRFRYSGCLYSVIFDMTTIEDRNHSDKDTQCHCSYDLKPLPDRIFVKYQILQTEGLEYVAFCFRMLQGMVWPWRWGHCDPLKRLNDTASHSARLTSPATPLWEHEISQRSRFLKWSCLLWNVATSCDQNA